MFKLHQGSKRSNQGYGLNTPCRCWHFDNGATSKIDDVLTEHDELLHFLPIAVHQGVATNIRGCD